MANILITGANRGIGLGLLKYHLEQGNTVVAGVRDTGADSLKALIENYGETLKVLALNLGDETSIKRFAAAVAVDSLDVVINNAGVCSEVEPAEWTFDYFEWHFRINSVAPMLLAQALSSKLSNGSKLINMTSGMGSAELNINPTVGLDAYAASKHALNILTHRLAVKLEEQGVVVAAISPGWVQTDMGGECATATVEEAVASISNTISGLTSERSGSFLTENGDVLPW
ncbi:MAG: SDR family oxidoreductase [Lentimonas sp.]